MLGDSPAVLLVEGDRDIRRMLRVGFQLGGFRVAEAGDWKTGLDQAASRTFELILVDLDPLGLETRGAVGQLVASGSAVIALSSCSRIDDKVVVLDVGASDYVTMPFGMPELLARSRAAVRRLRMTKPPVPPISVGALSVDLSSRLVALNGARVPLTQKEYRLLQILAQSAGQVVTHTRLLSEIWGKGSLESCHYLRILVRRVRQKIETNPSRPRRLVTELGVGYSLSPGGM